MKSVFIFFSVVITGLLVCGCLSAKENADEYNTHKITAVEDLWITDPDANADSEDVIIVLQGGPRNYLYFEKDGRTLTRYLPGYKDFHVVYLHQSQSLNPDLFKRGKAFTADQARQERFVTTDMLHRAVHHFKAVGKSVIVVAHSYGAFITIDYLATHAGGKADKYIITAGRTAVQQAMVQDNWKGLSSSFEEDGISYIPATLPSFAAHEGEAGDAYHVKALLKAAYGEPRYGSQLGQVNLENATFIFSASDQQVGRMTAEEIALLERSGATVIQVEGSHSDVYKRMIDAVGEGKISLK